jgi:hypothetical protein
MSGRAARLGYLASVCAIATCLVVMLTLAVGPAAGLLSLGAVCVLNLTGRAVWP